MATTPPPDAKDTQRKDVHVTKDHTNGKPKVPKDEEIITLRKAAGDKVKWEKGDNDTPDFKVKFDKLGERSPFESSEFNNGQTSDKIVVDPDPNTVYHYTIYFPDGTKLDPGIIIR
ncbi:MAG TPA: hypothetical protein VD837_09125 [Terriglobales bacterium]|nr:hypothetical protein [Terriglobales bacterium]